MYTLLDVCQHPAVLRILYFFLLIMDIVTVVVPIGLIIMLLVDFTKAVISSSESNAKKSTKLVTKRIMYAVIVFVVPWVISLVMVILEGLNFTVGDYNECFENAKTGDFEYYDNLLETERLIFEERRRKPSDEDDGPVPTGNKYQKAATELLNSAAAELGTVGGSKYSGMDPGVPWCAFFVMWNMKKINIDGESLYNYFIKDGTVGPCGGACVGDYIQNIQKKSILQYHKSKQYGGDYVPKKGDLIFFWYSGEHYGQYWDGTESELDHADHIGIVESSGGGHVNTIEGNSGGNGSAYNSVKRNTYSLSSSSILGYGSWYR